ncbi:hypothetical protein [Winogradskyella pulchriflava]|uniref:Outer membrane protein beta-barrel domain-containing protein n=1 Tax=Winogradskyella pulchriflava TaxID=1110688 RepID=A0ABV6QCG2_9FLAO
MQNKLLLVLYLLLSSFCFSQSGETASTNEPTKLELVFSPGMFVQKQIFTEINISVGRVSAEFPPKMFPIVGFEGFRAGVETNLRSNEDFIIAPKLGYEISLTFFSVRLSALNYFHNKESEFRILPELGVSLGGMFNLTYGYGISFKNPINDISNHRLSLSINLNRRLSQANIKLLGL